MLHVVINCCVSIEISIIMLQIYFRNKTAYDMRISTWISYVCSSDLSGLEHACHERHGLSAGHFGRSRWAAAENRLLHDRKRHGAYPRGDRRRGGRIHHEAVRPGNPRDQAFAGWLCLIPPGELVMAVDRKSTRLNSSH